MEECKAKGTPNTKVVQTGRPTLGSNFPLSYKEAVTLDDVFWAREQSPGSCTNAVVEK